MNARFLSATSTQQDYLGLQHCKRLYHPKDIHSLSTTSASRCGRNWQPRKNNRLVREYMLLNGVIVRQLFFLLRTFFVGLETGDPEVWNWMRKQGCVWIPLGCSPKPSAPAGCSIEVLKWLREHECPWGKHTGAEAAWRGDMEILRWLRENGCIFDPTSYQSAVLTDKLVNGWLLNKPTYCFAARGTLRGVEVVESEDPDTTVNAKYRFLSTTSALQDDLPGPHPKRSGRLLGTLLQCTTVVSRDALLPQQSRKYTPSRDTRSLSTTSTPRDVLLKPRWDRSIGSSHIHSPSTILAKVCCQMQPPWKSRPRKREDTRLCQTGFLFPTPANKRKDKFHDRPAISFTHIGSPRHLLEDVVLNFCGHSRPPAALSCFHVSFGIFLLNQFFISPQKRFHYFSLCAQKPPRIIC